jgi:hypothetical protein
LLLAHLCNGSANTLGTRLPQIVSLIIPRLALHQFFFSKQKDLLKPEVKDEIAQITKQLLEELS